MNKIINDIENQSPESIIKEDTLTTEEGKALKELTSNQDIVIKKADKVNTLVIMDKDYYTNKLVMNDHLSTNTYQKVDNNADKTVYKEMITLINNYKECFTDKEYKYLKTSEWKSSIFYVNPKIHKSKSIVEHCKQSTNIYTEMKPPEDLKARPIVASTNAPTKPLSILIEKLLSSIVPTLKSYVKDDWEFLRKLPHEINYDCQLFTCDIVSLYTSIPHPLGLTAIEYYVDKQKDLIPNRFSKNFILEALKFILENNNFIFNDQMYNQLVGTAMGGNVAPPYAILSIGYLEETKLFTSLPNYFNTTACKDIEDLFFRYMDDGFLPWNNQYDIEIFKKLLNNMHPMITFTIEPSRLYNNQQYINFLDVTVILHPDGKIETDIYYKDTNTHDYLNYYSHHPIHIKNNIPYNLAKRIIVFVSNPDKMNFRLNEMKSWLLNCDYPEKIIDKGFYNAKLQGPAPNPQEKKETIPFVSTYYNNYSCKNIVKTINTTFENSTNINIKNIFGNTNIVLSQRQTPNLLRILSQPRKENVQKGENGLFHCKDKRCKLCKLYIQECTEFEMSNGTIWKIKSIISCNSKNVIYFLKCTNCECSYIGKTNDFRKRMNGHISDSRHGNTTDKFDRHVFNCLGTNKIEPFFQIYALMTLNDQSKLLSYESYLHNKGLDTMNKKT